MKMVADYTHTVPDFPEPDVMFRDITIILQGAEGLHLTINGLHGALQSVDYDLIVGPGSRGFIFDMPPAYAEYRSFIPIRRQGKLSAETISETYELEYGHATIGVHKDIIKSGQRVVIVDGLIATSGTTEAMIRLIEELDGEIMRVLFMIELEGLHSRERLKGYPVFPLVSYEGK